MVCVRVHTHRASGTCKAGAGWSSPSSGSVHLRRAIFASLIYGSCCFWRQGLTSWPRLNSWQCSCLSTEFCLQGRTIPPFVGVWQGMGMVRVGRGTVCLWLNRLSGKCVRLLGVLWIQIVKLFSQISGQFNLPRALCPPSIYSLATSCNHNSTFYLEELACSSKWIQVASVPGVSCLSFYYIFW